VAHGRNTRQCIAVGGVVRRRVGGTCAVVVTTAFALLPVAYAAARPTTLCVEVSTRVRFEREQVGLQNPGQRSYQPVSRLATGVSQPSSIRYIRARLSAVSIGEIYRDGPGVIGAATPCA
jgi:hypothetical protein